MRDVIPQKSKQIIANSIIMGRLVHLIPLWGAATDNYLRKVQAILNWGARFVTKCKKRTRLSELMKRCNWLNAKELVYFHSLVQFWKLIKWKVPKILVEVEIEDVHVNANLR